MAEKNWWEEHDPEYTESIPKWRYTAAVYESDPDKLRQKGSFLVQKKQGEHADNYDERCELANFVPLFAAVVDAYVGRIQEAEKKIERRWNRKTDDQEEQGLGDEKDLSTLAGRIWHNADGRGTNYLPLLSQVSVCFTTKKVVWGLIEGLKTDEDGVVIGDPSIRLIDPEAVPITLWDANGNLVAAAVRYTTNVRASIFEGNDIRERYVVYMLDGTATFEIEDRIEKDSAGKDKIVQEAVRVDGGTGFDPIPYAGEGGEAFHFYDSQERNDSDRILPIFQVEMPTKRHPGYSLAHQNVTYFNAYSELQNKHRTCNIMKLQVPYTDTDNKDETGSEQASGSTIIWISPESNRDVRWVEPNAASLTETREWLRDMRSDFLFSALRGYEDSARGGQKTATESAQDSAEGEHSYLNMLAGALDEFEMQAWKRIEQIEWPNEPDKWGQFYVKRKRDFRPLDEEGEAERLRTTFFGIEPVPIGATGRANVAKRIGDLYETEYKPEEVDEEIRERADRASQGSVFGTPQDAIARLRARREQQVNGEAE